MYGRISAPLYWNFLLRLCRRGRRNSCDGRGNDNRQINLWTSREVSAVHVWCCSHKQPHLLRLIYLVLDFKKRKKKSPTQVPDTSYLWTCLWKQDWLMCTTLASSAGRYWYSLLLPLLSPASCQEPANVIHRGSSSCRVLGLCWILKANHRYLHPHSDA